MGTVESISKILSQSASGNLKTRDLFLKRAGEGLPTRDENPKTHFSVYFLPYNSVIRKVFMVYHKKSGLWLSPGGHIDKGETLFEALNREISEELGVKHFFSEEPAPFFLSITQIENKTQTCKTHYDFWYLFPTDGSGFNIDMVEFHDTKWLSISEARKIVTDESNLRAFDMVEKL